MSDELDVPPPARNPITAKGIIGAVFLLIGCAWIAAHVRWFWISNFALWNVDLDGDAGPAGKYGVFSCLFLPWTFGWDNTPAIDIAQAFVSLALAQGLGLLLLRSAQIYLRFFARHGLALTLGLGASGVAFELLTMAKLLYMPSAWVMWAMLYIGAMWLATKRSGQPVARWWGSDRTSRIHETIDGEEWPEFESRRFFERREDIFEAPAARVVHGLAIFAIIVMTGFTFWHAVLLPEGYWDSLILYLGYARMIFLEHSFPFKAEAQVGIGLGANYPHLYPLYGATASTLFAHWSDLPQRLLAPCAGLAATAMLYEAVRMTFRSRLAAVTAALLFRITPNVITYTTYASDYAITIMLAAALLLCIVYFARSRTPASFAVLLAIPAIGMHVNYLMVAFWGPAVIGTMLGLKRLSAAPKIEDTPIYPVPNYDGPVDPASGPPESPDSPSPFGLFASRKAWLIFITMFALGSTWLVRNQVLTGNPVYAFYPNIFTSSVRVNSTVLRSAEIEWYRNGDGIGRIAEQIRTSKVGREDGTFRRRATVSDRIAASWLFWTGFEVSRSPEEPTISWKRRLGALASGPDGVPVYQHFYKMAPLFPGFLPIGVAIALWMFVLAFRPSKSASGEVRAFLGASLLLTFGLLAYMYLIADFYLYQIVPVTVPAAALASMLVVAWEGQHGTLRRLLAPIFVLVFAAATLVPGFAMSLMNFKITTSREVAMQPFSQLELAALRNPGMPRALFYEIIYGPDVEMWDYANSNLKGEKLLTHENRHYVFDPSITMIHLDDWDMQQRYGEKDSRAMRDFLWSRGIRHYLFVPNELNHGINAQLGMAKLVQDERLATEEFRSGDNVLYALVPPPDAPGDEADGALNIEFEDSPKTSDEK